MPTEARIRSVKAISSSLAFGPAEKPAAPRPTSIGVFGMIRTIRSEPVSSVSLTIDRKSRLPASLRNGAAASASICGLTASRTVSAPAAAALQSAVTQRMPVAF